MRIIRPEAGESITALILSDHLYGILTHWDSSRRRTFPHFDPIEECPHCQSKMPFGHWRGYLAAYRPTQHRYVLVELTEHAAETAGLSGPPPSWLRGAKITLKRGETKKNDPVFAQLQKPLGNNWLPPEFNVVEALERIWAGELGKASEVYDRQADDQVKLPFDSAVSSPTPAGPLPEEEIPC